MSVDKVRVTGVTAQKICAGETGDAEGIVPPPVTIVG
jgi:hypothetical protein